MKIVINACFGGFSISPEAERAYLARKGKEAFFYIEDRESGATLGNRDLLRIPVSEATDSFMHYTSTIDLGERIGHKKLCGTEGAYFYCRDIDRADADLVAVVEELGEKADGSCAGLRIVEIPDGTEYEIEEYDGNEHVAEVHRTWR